MFELAVALRSNVGDAEKFEREAFKIGKIKSSTSVFLRAISELKLFEQTPKDASVRGNHRKTCTPLVAYWATDTSTLYQCSSPNIWTAYYTPYVYPHPLVSGTPPPPPPPVNPPVINSAASATGVVGTAFSYQIAATNNPTSFNAIPLPTGLSVNSTTGLIFGNPTVAGVFTSTISAINSGGTGAATLTMTIAASGGGNPTSTAPGNLDNVIVYPNPWRADRSGAPQITFKGLTGNCTIKIFTVSGHIVKTLGAQGSGLGTATWDLTNDSGDRVASGIYIYLVTNDQGQEARGKVVVIK